MNSTISIPTNLCVCALGVLLSTVTAAQADCPTIDFENLAVGTAVTSQYSGVTFSVQPQTCGNTPTLYMRIHQPPNGTSSGTKCIKIDEGCPSFSDDDLRMVFDNLQKEVSFTLGDWTATYTIRYYTNSSGGSPVGSFQGQLFQAGKSLNCTA